MDDTYAEKDLAYLRDDKLSPASLRLCWVGFILLHATGFAYFTASAWCYWNLPGTNLDRWLTLYYLGIGTEYDRSISAVFATVAGIHGAFILWMVGWSLKKGQVVFAVYNVFTVPRFLKRLGNGWWVTHKAKLAVTKAYRSVFTRDGVFGVDGPYFDLILLCREILETALQTHQAYRMSVLLPRGLLNRSYVALVVLNCWSTSLVHSIYHGSATKRRLWSLVCDCVLDFVSSVGISTVLVAIYIQDYDFERNGFPFFNWYQDIWLIHALSEFQMVLVSSWGDLATRMVFAFSMLGNMNSIKKLIRATPTQGRHINNLLHRATAVAPFRPSMEENKLGPTLIIMRSSSAKHLIAKTTQLVFFAWGALILALHLHAESAPTLPYCWMQVKPWVSWQPSCSLLVLDCHEAGLTGAKNDVALQWSTFDPTTVVRTVVRHCPALEMPTILTEFSNLGALKLYNTTIAKWDPSSAITQTSHPSLTTLFLLRVNMTGGELPLGLQSEDFPLALEDIEFCVTNLRSLPDGLEFKWPQYASIYIEASQLTEVPPSMVRLGPFDLSLSMNPISTLPAELFEQDSVGYLSFGGTLISQLPETVTRFSSLLFDMNLADTNMSFFWSWIDPMVADPEYPPLTAASTPYCVDLQRILAGEQLEFSAFAAVSEYEAQSSILLDASEENWVVLEKAVSCEEVPRTWYPIEFEDEYSKIA